jgi:hypothetical protein
MVALLLHHSQDVLKRGIVELEIEREFYLMNVRGAELILSAPLYIDFILHPEKLIKFVLSSTNFIFLNLLKPPMKL